MCAYIHIFTCAGMYFYKHPLNPQGLCAVGGDSPSHPISTFISGSKALHGIRATNDPIMTPKIMIIMLSKYQSPSGWMNRPLSRGGRWWGGPPRPAVHLLLVHTLDCAPAPIGPRLACVLNGRLGFWQLACQGAQQTGPEVSLEVLEEASRKWKTEPRPLKSKKNYTPHLPQKRKEWDFLKKDKKIGNELVLINSTNSTNNANNTNNANHILSSYTSVEKKSISELKHVSV